jgi:lysylphosphatidylglycerol synthetase-like protein (DUF2156 family)
MTTLGLLFGGLRLIDAPTPVYFYFGSLAMAISITQMALGAVPKGGSAILGGFLLPAWLIAHEAWDGQDLSRTAVGLPCTVFVGALLGYCTATLAVGVFSLLQMAEPFLRTKKHREMERPAEDE